MRIFNKIIESNKEPSNYNDIWFDGISFKIYKEGEWQAITSERTVYLTEIHEDGDYTLEITEEERAYNIETVNKVFEGFDAGNQKVFISLFGTFYFFQYGRISDDKKSATFGNVTEYEGVLHSMKVTITSEGDAIAETTQIQTGGGVDPGLLEGYMPLSRDFSDDFNNDFTR